METDSERIRNKKARKIQLIFNYPENPFNNYNSLINHLDKKLEEQVSFVYQGFFDTKLIRIMEVVDELCNSINIDRDYLNKLREQKIIRKGSYLDKMLEEETLITYFLFLGNNLLFHFLIH